MEEFVLNCNFKSEEIKKAKKSKIILYSILSAVFFIALILCCVVSPSGNTTTYYYIGETGYNASNTIAIDILEVRNTQTLGSGYLTETTTNNFIVVKFRIKNKGSSSITLYSTTFELYNSQKVQYDYKYSYYIDSPSYDSIASGISRDFEIAFETPTKTTDETYSFVYGHNISKNDKVYFYLTEKNV